MIATKKQYKTIDEYIKTFPENVQSILEKMRQTIRKAAPEAEEAISNQIPTFKLNGNLVFFAAFKNHIGFYPTPSGTGAFKKELSPYQGGKGSSLIWPKHIHFSVPISRFVISARPPAI